MLRKSSPEERALSARQLADYTLSHLRTWIGGSRRRSEDWNEPKNWFPVGVPDLHDRVVIGGYGRHRCYVGTEVEPVMSIHVLPEARLVVGPAALLSVDGLFADPYGVVCDSGLYNEGTVEVAGTLVLRNVTAGGILNEGLLCNRGRIQTCERVTRCVRAWGRYLDSGERRYA